MSNIGTFYLLLAQFLTTQKKKKKSTRYHSQNKSRTDVKEPYLEIDFILFFLLTLQFKEI